MSEVRIWKFELGMPSFTVSMPTHARVLSTAFQGDKLMVWAVVVTSNRQAPRKFEVVGTGWPAEGKAIGPFVGTAFHPNGVVLHVFDRGYDDPVEPSPSPSTGRR